jgi:hypothetical protein
MYPLASGASKPWQVQLHDIGTVTHIRGGIGKVNAQGILLRPDGSNNHISLLLEPDEATAS